MSKWKKYWNPPQTVKGFFKSIYLDIFKIKWRFKYYEWPLRNWPGELGIFLRYYLIGRKFKKIGKDVIFWQGIRLRSPHEMEIGDYVQLGYDNHYQASAGIKIGKNTILGPNVTLWTVNHSYTNSKKPIRDQGYEKSSIDIGEDCWLGTNVFVKAGSRIPNRCIVLPNSVIGSMNIKPGSVVGGNPAKIIGDRDLIAKFAKN